MAAEALDLNAGQYRCLRSDRRGKQSPVSHTPMQERHCHSAAWVKGSEICILAWPQFLLQLHCRYKLALVPMGDYVFVLSQFQTFGYCLVYFSFLASRYR